MSAADDSRMSAIRAALAALAPSRLVVLDDSEHHAGHAGARSGGGHYHVDIESERFAGVPQVARHRQIYAALGDLMGSAIHALAIEARAPGEDAKRRDPRPRSSPPLP